MKYICVKQKPGGKGRDSGTERDDATEKYNGINFVQFRLTSFVITGAKYKNKSQIESCA